MRSAPASRSPPGAPTRRGRRRCAPRRARSSACRCSPSTMRPAGASRSSPTAATPLAELDLQPPLTFVLGAEREGLPDELVARADEVATIPLAGRGRVAQRRRGRRDRALRARGARLAAGRCRTEAHAARPSRTAASAATAAATSAREAAAETARARRRRRERRAEAGERGRRSRSRRPEPRPPFGEIQ